MAGVLYSASKDSLGGTVQGEAIATFENGRVYAASAGFLGVTGSGRQIGRYDGGYIYDMQGGFGSSGGNCIAVYKNNEIFSVHGSVTGGYTTSARAIASCSNGKVYKLGGFMEYSDFICSYTGDDEGAAAAVAIAVFNLKSNVSSYDVQRDKAGSGNKAAMAAAAAAGAGSSNSGCGGVGLFFLLLGIGVIGVLCWQFWMTHPVISAFLLSLIAGVIGGILPFRSVSRRLITAVLAVIICFVTIFCVADMNDRYTQKSYGVLINNTQNGRGIDAYTNWKRDMYIYADSIDEFCENISVVSSVPVESGRDNEALFIEYSNGYEVQRADITLYNANTGEYAVFKGYADKYTTYVPLKDVAKWGGSPVTDMIIMLNFKK